MFTKDDFAEDCIPEPCRCGIWFLLPSVLENDASGVHVHGDTRGRLPMIAEICKGPEWRGEGAEGILARQ